MNENTTESINTTESTAEEVKVEKVEILNSTLDPEIVKAIYDLGYDKGKIAGATLERVRTKKGKRSKTTKPKKPPMVDRVMHKLGFERIPKQEKKGEEK